MSSPIKRREFLTLGVVLSGTALSGQVHADPQLLSVPPISTEGQALASEATARVGFPVTDAIASEVRQRLDGYPGDFAAARAFSIPNWVAPSMHLTPSFKIVQVANMPTRNTAVKSVNPAPTSAPTTTATPSNLPSDTDVKPLPVPASGPQN